MRIKFSTALFCIMFIAACGHGKDEAVDHVSSLDSLHTKKAFYLELMHEQQDKDGWLDFECDALLFNGMVYSSGLSVNVDKARDSNGQWYRTPSKDCYDLGKSASDISKDSLVGLMWGLHLQSRVDDLSALYTWGDAHDWVMGRGPIDRTYFLPQFQNTLRVLIGKKPNIPELAVDPLKDHQRHIEVLNWTLRGEKSGSISDDQLGVISDLFKLQPSNALFSYAFHRFSDGDQAPTIELLKRFPDERLPTSEDWCGRWLWERDERSEHWKPCEDSSIHSGGDFTFIVTLLEGSVKDGD